MKISYFALFVVKKKHHLLHSVSNKPVLNLYWGHYQTLSRGESSKVSCQKDDTILKFIHSLSLIGPVSTGDPTVPLGIWLLKADTDH